MFSPTRTIQSPSKAKRQPYIGCLNAFAPRARPATTLQMLTDDILLLVIGFIEVRDILALRQTSKHFFSMSKLRWVWLDAIKRHIINRGLPVPAGDMNLWMLSAEQLEVRAVHASKFHDNWCSSNPTARHTLSFVADQCLPDETLELHKSTVSHVAFLPGYSGQFLVTVVGRIIACWEVPFDGSGVYRVADHISHHPIEHLIVNEDKDSEATLAYLTGTLSSVPSDPATVVVLALDKFHGRFQEVSRLRSVRAMVYPLHAMHDSYLVLGHAPTIWYFQGQMEAVTLQSSLLSVQAREIRAVKIINRYMVIVRENCLQFIYTPIWKGMRTAWGQQPVSLFQIRSQVTEAVVIHRNGVSEQELTDWPSTPVTVLMRCREDGIDMIVQLDLLPGPNKVLPSAEDMGPSSRLPFAWCERVSAVPVPPSCQELHASPSGKGFCVETRTVSSRHSSYPARCLVGFRVTPPPNAVHKVAERAGAGEQQPAVANLGNDVHYSERPFYSRRCDMSEIIKRQYTIVSTAFEDTAGRIAIGDRNGQVEVLDFA
ncbi:hypothetical protein DAEQUDRAFT_730309 [Daedalea quercina L-15889]|uniref:F-box domain-containing protein n=1 Tax=Daedalea quercina L-15889 TaxID=1314783 RepID=A0A165MZZ4_9APHY|nr:hypothetical protein DAEQUDRAFT_730309 [Daedalea quercina L-15889]